MTLTPGEGGPTSGAEGVRRQLAAAHTEALRVGDSPIRADRLTEQLRRLARSVDSAGLTSDQTTRVSAALDDALRVLRRDDDGREAAKHLQAAMRLLEGESGRPSPFGDE